MTLRRCQGLGAELRQGLLVGDVGRAWSQSSRTVGQLQESLDELAVSGAGQRQGIERRVSDVQRQLEVLAQGMESGQLDRAGARSLVLEVSVELRALERAVLGTNQRAAARILESSQTFRAMILVFVIVGLLLLSAFSFLIIVDFFGTISAFVKVSRRIRTGEVGVLIKDVGSDELGELGQSFNVMSRYLASRRRRQNIYNSIVTKLNSTVGVQETAEIFLDEIITKTNLEMGAVYLGGQEGQQEEELLSLLAASSFSTAMVPEVVMVGEGVIGTAARRRQPVYLGPIPVSAFIVDAGVASLNPTNLMVLPMIYVGNLIGVLVLGSFGDFGKDERAFIEELVFQFTVSVANGVYHESVLEKAQALESKNDEVMKQKARVEAANEELSKANKVKSEFLANVTHELRTPLNSILGYTEMLQEDMGQEQLEVYGGDLRVIRRNAENLYELISNLLDLSSLESGELKLTPGRFDLGQLVREVYETGRPVAKERAIELVYTQASEEVLVESDRMRCRQILLNLMSNAIKFTEEGSVELSVGLRGGHSAWVKVKDTGIGISAEHQALIFRKFSQLDGSATRRYGGVGLGLAIAQRLCVSLGGRIELSSEPGEGSVFTVSLPLSWGVEQGEAPKYTSTSRHNAIRQDVVFLNEDVGELANLRGQLQEHGLTVLNVFSLDEARQALRQHAVGVLLLGVGSWGGDVDERRDVEGLIDVLVERQCVVCSLGGSPIAESIESSGALKLVRLDRGDGVMAFVRDDL
mgnify:CR=1 FL=1